MCAPNHSFWAIVIKPLCYMHTSWQLLWFVSAENQQHAIHQKGNSSAKEMHIAENWTLWRHHLWWTQQNAEFPVQGDLSRLSGWTSKSTKLPTG